MADTKVIQDRLGTLKNSLSQLNKTLVDNRAKGYLLRPASNSLSDVETFLLPRIPLRRQILHIYQCGVKWQNLSFGRQKND